MKEQLIQSENDKSLLLFLSKDILSCCTKEDIEIVVSNYLVNYFQLKDLMICLNHSDNLTLSTYIDKVGEETLKHPDFEQATQMKSVINDGVFNIIEASDLPVVFNTHELMSGVNKPFYISFWYSLNVKEIIGFPLRIHNECIGVVTIYSKIKNEFTPAQLNLIQILCSYIGIVLHSVLLNKKMQAQLDEINTYKERLAQENYYLQEQIKSAYKQEEIIGSKGGLQKIFQLISNVAASDSTVLIMGETGTGKELIAKEIHNVSPRKDKLMIKINCAAFPEQLIESELFGHEKGSFTGATEQHVGKFEMANNSTIFLDEIGEMTLGLQVKLLRAIQEKEIERIGGKGIIKTNVRIIAATNRDLKKEVEAGRFRADLYYRLNVFPIILPALRERKEDIPILVAHFMGRFAIKFGKKIDNIIPEAMKELMLYNWMGNIRELEYVIERTVLMTAGNTITEVQLPRTEKKENLIFDEKRMESLEQNERDYILLALKKSNGRIRGANGAAAILKVPPTTLHSKIKKLGIKKTVA